MPARKSIPFALTLLALVTLACNLTRLAAGATPTPQFDLALTLTALLPTAAPTQTATPTASLTPPAPVTGSQPTPGVPVVPITPIATYAPPPVNQPPPANPGGQIPPGAARVAFDANATAVLLNGLLPGNTYVEYVVRAQQGQWMEVGLTTPNSPAVLSVYVPATGQVLLSQAAGQTGWRGWLPTSADYVLRLTASAADTNYTLQVIIPERVSFAAGAVTAQRGGPIRARETHAYLLRAVQGQIMTVSITAPGGEVLLAIYGLQDGQPYKRYEVGDPQYSFQLPATQDYVIQAVSVRDTATNFTIDFRVE